MKKVGIYIHIPFCKKRCHYCSFISSENLGQGKIAAYFKALKKELKMKSDFFKDYKVDTVYFGGGTPSFIAESYIVDVLQTLKLLYNVSDDAEISMEGNPDSLLLRDLKKYVDCGINRFSIGLQAYDEKQLRLLGRSHTIQDFENTVSKLQGIEIKNISVDIMLGLPNQTADELSKTLQKLVNLDVPHISAYGIKLEQGTKMHDDFQAGRIVLPSDDFSAELYLKTCDHLEQNNIYRYEVSNFAKEGYHCRHNLKYWKMQQYLGIGIAAHSFINNVRMANTENFDDYIGFFEQQDLYLKTKIFNELINNFNNHNQSLSSALKPLFKGNYVLDTEFEYIMLNLRLSQGINRQKFKNKFNCDIFARYNKVFSKYKDFFIVTDDYIKANRQGFLVLNSLLVEFMN